MGRVRPRRQRSHFQSRARPRSWPARLGRPALLCRGRNSTSISGSSGETESCSAASWFCPGGGSSNRRTMPGCHRPIVSCRRSKEMRGKRGDPSRAMNRARHTSFTGGAYVAVALVSNVHSAAAAPELRRLAARRAGKALSVSANIKVPFGRRPRPASTTPRPSCMSKPNSWDPIPMIPRPSPSSSRTRSGKCQPAS
jgi:hypothetical protein